MRLSISKTIVRRVVAGLVLAPVVTLGCLATSIVTYAGKSDGARADAAIVLGAAVADGVPTPVFEQRLLHAVGLYEHGRVDRLILTGGVGAGDVIAESEAARDYCLARGVPATALVLEAASHSTEENLVNARELVAAYGVGRVVIVSDPLHERRAVTIARDLGLDAHPSPTPTTRYTGIRTQGYFLARETYFYARYLARRALGYNAAELAVAPEPAQRVPRLHPAFQRRPGEPGRSAARAKSAEVGQMASNWQVTQVAFYRDGGTTDVALENGGGENVVLRFDHQLGSKTKGRLFIQPERAAAIRGRMLELGGKEERYWLEVLRGHLNARYTEAEQNSLRKRAIASDRWFLPGPPLGKDEARYWWILDRVSYLENLSVLGRS